LFADKARATDRLTAIGGDDAAARLEAERRTLLLEIEDLALRYLRLRSGSLVTVRRDKQVESAATIKGSSALLVQPPGFTYGANTVIRWESQLSQRFARAT